MVDDTVGITVNENINDVVDETCGTAMEEKMDEEVVIEFEVVVTTVRVGVMIELLLEGVGATVEILVVELLAIFDVSPSVEEIRVVLNVDTTSVREGELVATEVLVVDDVSISSFTMSSSSSESSSSEE